MTAKTQTTNYEKATETVAPFQTSQDLKDAVLIVSVIANLFVATMWMVTQLA